MISQPAINHDILALKYYTEKIQMFSSELEMFLNYNNIFESSWISGIYIVYLNI